MPAPVLRAVTLASIMVLSAVAAPRLAAQGTPVAGRQPSPPPAAMPATGPSFACNARNSRVQALICGDAALTALDRKLATLLTTVAPRQPEAVTEQSLAVMQRHWQEERDSCDSTPDPRKCVSSVYRARIAELQGQYRLVPVRGPFAFACAGGDIDKLVITYFETDPPSASMETAKGVNLMFVAPSASGARYVGDGVQYWEAQGAATVTWNGVPGESTCRPTT